VASCGYRSGVLWTTASAMWVFGHRGRICRTPPGAAIVNARHWPPASGHTVGAGRSPLKSRGVGPARERPLGRGWGPATGSGEVGSGDRAQEAAAAEPLLAFVFAGAESFDDDDDVEEEDDEELDESDELEEPEESEELDVDVDVEAAELTVLDEEARLSVR
jgi:hypothetical protein